MLPDQFVSFVSAHAPVLFYLVSGAYALAALRLASFVWRASK